jgi:hypothetical protein
VVEGEHVGRAFVLEELLVEQGHLGGSDQVEAQFVIRSVELLLQRPAGDAAKQASIDGAHPLPIAQPEGPAHGLAARCSS